MICDRVEVVIVGEFGIRDFVCPGTRVGPAKDLKVCLNFLVNTFCFTVRLRVIGGGEGEVIIEELSKFLSEDGCELWTTIGDDFVIKSEVQVDFVEEEGGYPLSGDRFLGGAENYPLSKAMVDHNQQRVKAKGNREVSDEVTGDLLERARSERLT